MITYHLMTEKEREIISAWHYAGDCAVYNMPSYSEQKEKSIGFGNPQHEKNFYTYWDEHILIGFTNILEEPKEIFIGIGVAPDICGCGYGQKILRLAREIAGSLYPGKPLYLEVRTWNARAIACYKKAGFAEDGEPFAQETMQGPGHFLRMVCRQN